MSLIYDVRLHSYLRRLFVQDGCRSLVVREDKSVGNDDVFPPADVENDNFGNVLGSKWLAAAVMRMNVSKS
jgi:hypothetical protein